MNYKRAVATIANPDGHSRETILEAAEVLRGCSSDPTLFPGLDAKTEAAVQKFEQYENAKDELLIGIALGVGHLLRYAEKAWPESGVGAQLADSLSLARERFRDAR